MVKINKNREKFVMEDWGSRLGNFINSSEKRVAGYKKQIENLYKLNKKDLIPLIKAFKQSEEKWLKNLREEKTSWNDGSWPIFNPSAHKSRMETEDKIEQILISLGQKDN